MDSIGGAFWVSWVRAAPQRWLHARVVGLVAAGTAMVAGAGTAMVGVAATALAVADL
jgi:hypothetical protein